jgi:hypothetical protein
MRTARIEDMAELLEKQLASEISKMTLEEDIDPRSRIQPLSQFDGYHQNPSQVYGSY